MSLLAGRLTGTRVTELRALSSTWEREVRAELIRGWDTGPRSGVTRTMES